MEKRNQELDVRIRELQNKGLSIEDLEKETTKAKGYMNALKNRLFFLSWIGAVLVPSLFFIISLVLSVLGINSDILLTELGTAEQDFLVHNLLLYSVISLGLGFSFLLLVIGIIDSAARKIPIPEFEVYFTNLLKTLKCKRKQMSVVTLCIRNKGEDLAEDAMVMVHFPSTFQLQPVGYRIIKQGPETDHPDYNSAILEMDRIYPDTIINVDIRITTPDDNEIHEIFVSIYETKSGHSEYKLTIQTTD
jgi:hypothetical protein